ncbi:DoxX family membrane protein [Pedobacter frigidisoli]|uniref:DoxX family membrane protein n=1 Tax=Pedobacter frigidisoli TaxID=2530455 RepID=A0A4R0P370_9SPHI|nr:DoxX family membrane protein [Pedobacter frigidisoli]TCD07584.1 DoxX family membrane protein [Pedobacter frigidisoli]
MKLFKKIQDWGDHHHPKWLDYFRILLGIVLVWKGIDFYMHMEVFNQLMRGTMLGTAFSISLAAHLIIIAHIIGGVAIALGTHTRLFCIVNLPILIGAVFFINISAGIFKPYSEFWFSSLVLIGLICFIVEGDGVISVEREKAIS